MLIDRDCKLLELADRVYSAVLVKDVEGDEVSEVTPAPEVVESIPVPVVASVPTPPSDAFLKESEPTPAEPVIGDLDAAREVEPHAAELEVAPEPIETVTVVWGASFWVFIHG